MALRFTPALIEEIKAQTDIVALVSEHVALRRAGKNFVGLCPFHPEKTPSFTVSPDKQMFHCFGCQAGGDAITFIMRLTGSDFPTAVEELARRAGVDVSRYVASPAEQRRMQRRQRLLDVQREAAAFFAQVLRSAYGRQARAYLHRRGIDPDTMETFQLGYAPSPELFRRFLSRRGIEDELALEAGLLIPGRAGRPPFPRFRDRLMFPIWDRGGRVVGFGGRLLADGVRAPKYLNSPETPLFSKRRVLYGAHLAAQAAKDAGAVIVVEGYMDCISLHRHGVKNAVASLGTAFTEEQARELARLAERAVVAFDADAAGEAATLRSLDLLAAAGLRVAVLQLPPGLDPDDFVRRHGPGPFAQLVRTALPLTEYKLNKVFAGAALDTVEGRALAVERAAAVIAGLESAVEREGYVRLIAERSGATPEAVRAELARVQARSSKNGASRHTRAEIRHNNKGFPGTKHEHTPHGPRAGGDLLSYAEQVILRHVLADAGRTDDLAALDVPGAWSGEAVAGAVALLRQRPPGVPAAQWLDGLPDGAPAALLRAVWADRSIPDVPWEDARRELGRQRGRRALAMLEERLQAVENESDLTAALRMTARLLVEYKRLRSLPGER